jgi:hypothetical protein
LGNIYLEHQGGDGRITLGRISSKV